MAIADDLGAILVIAIFYASDISFVALGVAAVFLIALVILNRARVYSPLPYVVLGIGLWLAFLESGVHPTIAGVLLAMTIPSRSPANMPALLAQVISLLQAFQLPVQWREKVDSRRQAAVSTLEAITERMQSPAQRLEESLTPWTTYLILPLFALANAGVAINPDSVGTLTSRLSLGIIFGLVVGKPLGIGLISWVATRLGLASLPGGIEWPQFISAGFLAGIGFTMSLFITNAAFSDPVIKEASKLAILVASILAAALGSVLMYITSPSAEAHTDILPETATD
jgi:NhaA family Na+:H+ antiporter